MTDRATGGTDRGPVRLVVTGGQSGVDRAATDAAIAWGVPYGGWVPRDGWAEDAPDPPGLLARYTGFSATDERAPAARTVRNVASADAVLVLRRRGARSPGTELTVVAALRLGHPLAVLDPRGARAADRLRAFARTLPRGAVLMVAGPRESESPGSYAAVEALLGAHGDVLFGRAGARRGADPPAARGS